MTMALLMGVIVWAVWAYEGVWWEKALVGAGTLVPWIVGGLLGCLLFAGVVGLFFFLSRLRKKAALRRLLNEDAAADPAAAIALAKPMSGSVDSAYDDILRSDPALCRQLVEAARRRLAERYRGDLAALRADERVKLDAHQRQSLDRLMQAGSEPA